MVATATSTLLPIVIVHHNTPELLGRCLQALTQAPVPLLPIVVDTSGVDTSPEAARACARQHVDAVDGYFITCQNHSLAQAVNVGVQAALSLSHHPALVCMNADVFVRPDVWTRLLEVLQQPHIGMVGPVCHDGRGRWQAQGFLYYQYYVRLQLARWLGLSGHVLGHVLGHVAVPWLSGCLQVIKREALLEVGGMNSSLRFYNEDMEWCWRLRRAGWACHLVDASSGSRENVGNIRNHMHSGVSDDMHHSDDMHRNDANETARENTTADVAAYQQKHPVVHLGGSATPARVSFVIEGYRGGYRLSQMYRSPAFQTLHRLILRGLIWQQTRQLDTHQQTKMLAAYDRLRMGLARAELFESPFGDTLQTENPDFGAISDFTFDKYKL